MAAALQLGTIVWAEVADANGFVKLRPAVIVTPTEQIGGSSALHAVAITSRLIDPPPTDHVLLPWHAQGHPRTGLNRKMCRGVRLAGRHREGRCARYRRGRSGAVHG